MILALEVCGFGKAIGVGARPGRRPSFPDKAWATWCPLLARGPPAPAPKWPHSQHPGGLLPPATLPLPTYLSAQGLGDILLPPSPRPKHTQLSRESPLSTAARLRGCVCMWGGGVVCLGCSEASSNHSPASQGSSVSWLLARAGGPGVGERGTPGPCSLGPRHTALLL